MPPLPPPRVVVTAHAQDGTSVFACNGPAAQSRPFGSALSAFALLDIRPSVPVNNQEPPATELSGTGVPRCPPGGVAFLISDIPPGGKAPMHRTETIDYAVVMEGAIVLTLDNGQETTVKAGECIVQGGANHAWDNRSDTTCRIAFIMVSANRVKLEDGTELVSTLR